MTIQLSAIQSSTTVSANGYVAFGQLGAELSDTLLTVPVVSSSAVFEPLIGVYTTVGASVISIVKIRSSVESQAFSPIFTTNVFDTLVTPNRIYAIGATPGTTLEIRTPPRQSPWIEIPVLPADVSPGIGRILSTSTIGTQSNLPLFTLEIRVNYIKIPDPVSIEGLNRESIELERNQKAGIETQSSKEFSLVLAAYEQGSLSIDNNTIEQRKRFATSILGSSKSKDRRTVISSLVNNYSRATKRS
jgi:hypothetical protein